MAQADAINEWGVVVGSHDLADNGRFATVRSGANRIHAPVQSEGYGINNRGQVVGSTLEESGRAAMLWDPLSGQVIRLTPVGGDNTAEDINDLGDIVGRSRVETGETHVFLWRVVPRIFGTRGDDR